MAHEYVRPATIQDIMWLIPRLRQADIDEVQAYLGIHPGDLLPQQLTLSDPCNVMVAETGEVVGIFGVFPAPDEPGLGYVWMHCTDSLAKFPFQFLRRCIKGVKDLQEKYRVLTNVVDARNEVHIKWLKWCGFRFIARHEQMGVAGLPFYEFVRI